MSSDNSDSQPNGTGAHQNDQEVTETASGQQQSNGQQRNDQPAVPTEVNAQEWGGLRKAGRASPVSRYTTVSGMEQKDFLGIA